VGKTIKSFKRPFSKQGMAFFNVFKLIGKMKKKENRHLNIIQSSPAPSLLEERGSLG
jgi:hypothetical protein